MSPRNTQVIMEILHKDLLGTLELLKKHLLFSRETLDLRLAM